MSIVILQRFDEAPSTIKCIAVLRALQARGITALASVGVMYVGTGKRSSRMSGCVRRSDMASARCVLGVQNVGAEVLSILSRTQRSPRRA